MEADAWVRSGAMALTGWPEGPGLHPGRRVTEQLDRLVAAIGDAGGPALDWGRVLTARAASGGFRRNGRTSLNGACRLLPAAGGWVAVTMARPWDWEMLLPLVGTAGGWEAIGDAATREPARSFVARARLLSVPAAVVGERRAAGPPWRAQRVWPGLGSAARLEGALVVDLSALWAGPLAAHVLSRCGARVVKVESAGRPDTARADRHLYTQLHAADQEVVVLDFADGGDRSRLRRLLAQADVVVEASRPRALEQLGCGPVDVEPGRPGRVWLSITGHGRQEPYRDWVAFGDDAAAAGGLVARDATGSPVFCADAIADPVTGLFGALAVLCAVRAGGGVLVDLPMSAAAAAVAPDWAWDPA